MRFSIVIPVYNVEKYLSDCLNSVLSQNFYDYEIVLVNDGSTDSSPAICRQFASANKNAKLIQQKNRGLLLARRAGIYVADGEYILSLDSDDALRQDALYLIDREIKKTGSDVICFDYSRSETVWHKENAELLDSFLAHGFCRNAAINELCSSYRMNAIWSKAISKSCICRELDYLEFAGVSMGEDILQMIDIIDKAESYAYVDEALYYYRTNEKSLTKKFDRKKLDDICIVYGALIKKANAWAIETGSQGLVDSAYQIALQSLISLAINCLSSDEKNASFIFLDELAESTLFKELLSNPGVLKSCRKKDAILFYLLNRKEYGVLQKLIVLKNLKSIGSKDVS